MINYYRKHGHLAAKLDPLKLLTQSTEFPSTLDFGVKYNDNVDTKDLLIETPNNVEQLEKYLQSMYTNTVGV
jgi:2-oxoglutarate dehydrogenase complex dehydrogenase (E1) component-like enzyme